MWANAAKLTSALASKAERDRAEAEKKLNEQFAELRKFTENSENELKKVINWNQFGDGIARLRRGLGMGDGVPNLIAYGIVFVVMMVICEVAFSKKTADYIGIAATFLMWSLMWKVSRKFRLQGLLSAVKPKLMRFHGNNPEASFPLEFTYLQYQPTTNDVILGVWGLPEGAVRIPKENGCAVGIFKNQDQLVGVLSIDSTGKNLYTFNYGDVVLPLNDRCVGNEFDAFTKNEIKARGLYDAIIGAQSDEVVHPKPTVEELREAWCKVVLRPEELNQLVRAQLLFIYSDPSSPRGILLKGPPGTGKSLSAQVFAESSGAHFFKLSIADMKGELIGSSAANVKRLWQEARANQPSVIFIDECEGVFAKRGSDQGDSFVNEVVQTFLTEWDGIGGDANVLIIGATNRPELLDDAIVSRFTDIFELLPTDSAGIAPLIEAVIRQLNLTVSVPSDVAKSMTGMNGREVRNAIQQAMRLAAPNTPTSEDFATAIGKIRGKSSTKVADGASWDTLILPDKLKTKIKTLSQMIKEAGNLAAKGIPVPRTLLLYGPPGTGKTQIARTMANESGVNFISRTTADLKGQYLGHAAARIAQTFETARSSSPSILFIDEIDALASSRSVSIDQLQAEAVTQLLQELDGVASKSGFVLVVAATNLLDQLDSAILSRFSQKLEIPLPSQLERAAILQTLLTGRPIMDDIDAHHVASICEGFSGRDIKELVSQAFNLSFQRTMAEGKAATDILLNMTDLKNAIAQA